MKYLEGSFSVHPGSSKAYRDNWDRIFKKDGYETAEDNDNVEDVVAADEPKEIPPAPPELLEPPKKSKKRGKKNGKR